jgi:hypothetical protein
MNIAGLALNVLDSSPLGSSLLGGVAGDGILSLASALLGGSAGQTASAQPDPLAGIVSQFAGGSSGSLLGSIAGMLA